MKTEWKWVETRYEMNQNDTNTTEDWEKHWVRLDLAKTGQVSHKLRRCAPNVRMLGNKNVRKAVEVRDNERYSSILPLSRFLYFLFCVALQLSKASSLELMQRGLSNPEHARQSPGNDDWKAGRSAICLWCQELSTGWEVEMGGSTLMQTRKPSGNPSDSEQHPHEVKRIAASSWAVLGLQPSWYHKVVAKANLIVYEEILRDMKVQTEIQNN